MDLDFSYLCKATGTLVQVNRSIETLSLSRQELSADLNDSSSLLLSRQLSLCLVCSFPIVLDSKGNNEKISSLNNEIELLKGNAKVDS